jgi:hypothetical protein
MKPRYLWMLAAGVALLLIALPGWAQQEQQQPQPEAQQPAENATDNATDNPSPNENEITIPEGTEFKLQLHSSVSSKTSHPGDRILTTLLDPVAVEDQDVLAKGTRIDGHIAEVKAAGRRGKGGDLSLVFDTVELPNGQKLAITGSLTEVFSSEGGGDPNVGPEGDLKGGGASRKKQAAIIAGTTAVGATAGLGPGIAAAAAGVTLAMLLPHGKQAALAAGSLIGMRLDRDVTFSLAPAPAAKQPEVSNQ